MFSLLEAAPPTAPKPVRDGARKLQGLVGLACRGLCHREAVEREVAPSLFRDRARELQGFLQVTGFGLCLGMVLNAKSWAGPSLVERAIFRTSARLPFFARTSPVLDAGG